MKHALWPVSPRLAALMAVVGAVASVVVVFPLFDWQPGDWARFDAVLRERSPFAAVAVAIVGGMAGRSFARDKIVFMPVVARPRLDLVTDHVLKLGLVLALGMTAPIVLAAVRTGQTAAVGSLNGLALTASLAAVFCAVPLGFALGAVVPHVAWPASVAILTLTILLTPMLINALVLPNTGRSTLPLALAWGLSIPRPGLVTTFAASLLKVSYSCLLSVAVVVGFSTVTTQSGLRRAAGWSVSAAPAVFMGLVALISPSLHLVATPPWGPSCRDVSDQGKQVVLCISAEHSALKADVADIVASTVRLSPDSNVPAAVVEDSVGRPAPDGGGRVVELRTTLPSSRELYLREVADVVAAAVTGREACRERLVDLPAYTTDETVPDALEMDDAVRQRLVLAAGLSPLSSGTASEAGADLLSPYLPSLSALSDESFAAWFAEHADDVALCRLAPSDAP